jgi:hypothetical protein
LSRPRSGNLDEFFLDDERVTGSGWTRVFWPEDAIGLLKAGNMTEISHDHDLDDDDHVTGYDGRSFVDRERGDHLRLRYATNNYSVRQFISLKKMEAGIRAIELFVNNHQIQTHQRS